MKHVICNADRILGPWMAAKLDTQWYPGRGSVIGLFDEGSDQIVAGAWFESFNGASILCHLASEGKNWLNREFLWFINYYPFEQLKVEKVISPVESTNLKSIRFVESFGLTLEATLKDAAPKGDLLLYTLRKADAKWLSLRGKYRGKTQGSGTARLCSGSDCARHGEY